MRLIDADALKEVFERYYNAPHVRVAGSGISTGLEMGIKGCLSLLGNAHTIEAEPVKHGRWLGLHDGWYYSYSCSECGAEALTKEETMHDQVCSAYCPNCGARMDLRANDGLD